MVDQHPFQGGLEILLTTTCYRCRDKPGHLKYAQDTMAQSMQTLSDLTCKEYAEHGMMQSGSAKKDLFISTLSKMIYHDVNLLSNLLKAHSLE